MTDHASSTPHPRAFALGLEWHGGHEPRRVDIDTVAAEAELFEHLRRNDGGVVLLGPLLTPAEVFGILRRCAQLGDHAVRCIVSGVAAEAAFFQLAVDDDTLYYFSKGRLDTPQLEALVEAASGSRRPRPRESTESTLSESARPDWLLDYLGRLSMQADLPNACGLLVDVLRGLNVADAGQCLVYDDSTHTLWSTDEDSDSTPRASAAAGLVGFVARTGEPVALLHLEADPRYDHDADGPPRGRTSFVAEPMTDADGTVLAVVTAVRHSAGPFSTADVGLIRRLVACSAPVFSSLRQQHTLKQRVLAHTSSALADLDLYRPEALRHQLEAGSGCGRLLQTSPPWLPWIPPVMLAAIALSVGALGLVRIPAYVKAEGWVRARQEVVVEAPTTGHVDAINVKEGQRVEAGTLVGRLSGASDAKEYAMKAVAGGVVAHVWALPGQWLSPGDRIASIVDEAAGYEFIAFAPASYESEILQGMSMVVRIRGYADSPQTFQVDEVGPVLMNRSDAARRGGETMRLTGPTVAVRSRLRPDFFRWSGRSIHYSPGMQGDVDVRLSAESVLRSTMRYVERLTQR